MHRGNSIAQIDVMKKEAGQKQKGFLSTGEPLLAEEIS